MSTPAQPAPTDRVSKTLKLCSKQINTWICNRQNVVLAASSTAVLFLVSVLRRARRRGVAGQNESTIGAARRSGQGRNASIDQKPCPILWQQIQQRDWLFGLPPEIADAILARLDVPDLKALRATCRQTYLQVAARTTKLVLALDVSPRTWRLASPRLDSIYPGLRELHLILAGERDRDSGGDMEPGACALQPSGPADGSASLCRQGSVASTGIGSGGLASSVSVTTGGTLSRQGSWRSASGGGASRRWLLGGRSSTTQQQLQNPPSPRCLPACKGGGGRQLGGTGQGSAAWFGPGTEGGCGVCRPRCRPSGPECLREFLTWSANGHLHNLTLLDLSRCAVVPLQRDTWAALVSALGPGDVTLRVAWRCLLQHSAAAASGAVGSRSGGNGSAAAKAAAKAAAAAAAAQALTSPLSPSDASGSLPSQHPYDQLHLQQHPPSFHHNIPNAHQQFGLSPLPPAPPPRCSCSICGPAPPDVFPVVSALLVLAKLRPACSVELEGRGLPVRSPATLQQLCAISQLASVSLAVCGGVRPLADQAGWFSCLRRLHSLELRYREEPGGDGALHQILRALQAPVPLRSLILHRQPAGAGPAAAGPGPGSLLLEESDLAALAALTSLRSLDAPGLRVHTPTQVVMPGLTRLALRSDRLELTQPLVALFPSLEQLELGHGSADLPPTSVLALAAAAPAPGGIGLVPNGGVQPVPVQGGAAAYAAAAAAAWLEVEPLPLAPAAGGPVLADEVVPQPPAAGAQAAGQPGGLPQQLPLLAVQPGQATQLPPELTLHLRLLQGLSGLRALSIGGKPGHGVEALSSLTALSSLSLVRCSEFRPLRKAVEELRGLTHLRALELHACLGGDACGYEIARLLRRLQKLPNLERLVVHGCDPRLPQQLATAPLGRLAELQLLGLPELQPLDLRYVVQAQTALRRLVVRGCGRLERRLVEAVPVLVQRPQLSVEWALE